MKITSICFITTISDMDENLVNYSIYFQILPIIHNIKDSELITIFIPLYTGI